MDAEICRENALKCFRLAQMTADTEVRRSLFQLMVQWRQLADQFDQLNRRDQSSVTAG